MKLNRLVFGGLILVSLSFPSLIHADNSDNKKKGETVECPAELDKNFDDLLQLWANDKNRLKDCLYNTEDPVLCADSTYINRLYALPSEMELAFNPIVKQFIEMYANRRRGQVGYMLGKGRYYFPLFEEALDKEGLPLELKYLPVIESALNPVAKSRAGATGLWQFMSATGKMYKLEINSLVDERRDPYKSTQAAVKYLKDMYAVYQDWNLVIAAYNCGPGNVNKAIKRSGGKKDYWEIYPYLPKETRGYVPAFIAATYIMNYYPQHNICPVDSDMPTLVDTLRVHKTLHFQQVADMIGVSVDDLRTLNPEFKNDIVPGEYKDYFIKLPITDLTAFIEKEDTIYAHRAEELLTHQRIREVTIARGNTGGGGGYATYKVRKGDTLGSIAMRNGVSVAQLKSWNDLGSDRLSIGKMLQVSAYVAPPKPKEEKVTPPKTEIKEQTEYLVDNGELKKSITTTKNTTSTYKVLKNDTWATIVAKTGSSADDIKKWNNLRGNKLIAGKNLKINKTEVVEESIAINKPDDLILTSINKIADDLEAYVAGLSSGANTDVMLFEEEANSDSQDVEDEDWENVSAIYHEVTYGETLSQIAAKYNVSVADILSWNNIKDANTSTISRLLIIVDDTTQDQIMVVNDNGMESTSATKL